jgi:CspA family cold shock protein
LRGGGPLPAHRRCGFASDARRAKAGIIAVLDVFKTSTLRFPFSLPPPASRSRFPHVDFLGVMHRAGVLPRGPLKESNEMTIQTGTVKWFNAGKGYGFIAPDGGGKDLFAHFREIQGGDGFKTLNENDRVQFEIAQGPKGDQASNITAIAA